MSSQLDNSLVAGDKDISLRDIVPRSDLVLSLFVAAVVLAAPVIVSGVLVASGARWWEIALVWLVMLGLTAAVFFVVVQVAWQPRARQFPDQPIRAGAVARSGHSIAFGFLCRFNGCVTVIADVNHLHLVPIGVFRLFGARRISIPWHAIRRVWRSVLPRYSCADVGGFTLTAPAWCLDLAGDSPNEGELLDEPGEK